MGVPPNMGWGRAVTGHGAVEAWRGAHASRDCCEEPTSDRGQRQTQSGVLCPWKPLSRDRHRYVPRSPSSGGAWRPPLCQRTRPPDQVECFPQ